MSRSSLTRRGFLGGLGAGAAVVATGLPVGAAHPHPAVDSYPADVVPTWFGALYDAVVAAGPTPPAAARTYAYASIAMYEAAVAGMPDHRSLAGQVRGLRPTGDAPTVADWPVAVSSAALTIGRALLPAQGDGLQAVHDAVVAGRRNAGAPTQARTTAERHGRRIAKAVLAMADADGYAGTADRPYTPPVGPGMWESTPPNFGTAIEPYWAEVHPMVLTSGDEVAPEPHVPYSTTEGSPFWNEAQAVLDTAAALTDEHRAIARFWTDNPRTSGLPSGHWHLIAAHLSAVRSLPLGARLEVHARLGIALHDAFTNCWVWKYRYNLLRPVTYIRASMGQPGFNTLVNTPQFPEYTSGHSVASGAAAVVLTDLFGPIAFTDESHEPRGHAPRHFASIWAAAEEAAQSRIYGGIHYPMGIEAGVAQGRDLGELVVARLQTRG